MITSLRHRNYHEGLCRGASHWELPREVSATYYNNNPSANPNDSTQQCTEDEAASQDGTNADYGDSADGDKRRSSDKSDRDQSQQV